MGKEMTLPQQRVALDMIMTQDDHGGMSNAAILLHQKQAEDAEKMDKRMSEIEKKVDSLDRKVDSLDKKVDDILELVSNRCRFWDNVKDVLSNKVFIYILITVICAVFGVSVGEVGVFLFQ